MEKSRLAAARGRVALWQLTKQLIIWLRRYGGNALSAVAENFVKDTIVTGIECVRDDFAAVYAFLDTAGPNIYGGVF